MRPYDDVKVAREILELVPGATVGFKGDACVMVDLTDANNPYHGLLRHNHNKEKVLALIRSLERLQYLDLRKCMVRSLPYLGHLRNLEYLDLGSNDLGAVPLWVCRLDKLRYLNVGVNNLYALPEHLGDCDRLEILKCHKNKLIDLPSTLRRLKIKCLNMYLNRWSRFPPFIWDFNYMEEFSWGVSAVECIPSAISGWPNLKYLTMVANKIEHIAHEFCFLDKLEGVRLHKNRIKQLPEHIGNLKNLRQLTLYKNEIRTLPESFFELTFDKLNLAKNPLEEQYRVRLKSEWLMVDEPDEF